jgi:hypothetical protein
MGKEYQNWQEFKKDCPLVYPFYGASVEVCATRDREVVQSGFVRVEVEHAMKQEHDCTEKDCHLWRKKNENA